MLKRLLFFCAAFSVAPAALAGPWDDIIKYGYAVSGGPLTGAMGSAVCEQADDDTTPSIGTPPASLPSGCNILLTSTNHSGPISITRFDDAESGVEPVTSTLYEQVLWVFGRAASNQTTIADGANFRLKEIPWVSPATGDHSVIQFKATYLTSTITSVANGGGGTSLDITSTAHGLVNGQTVTLSSMSIATYDGTYVINGVADPNTFNVTQTWDATATGTWDAIRFDEAWRSGNVDDYFYQQIFVNQGNITDFANAQAVVGHSDSGQTSDTDRIGLIGEAAADGSNEARGLAGYAKTSSAEDATGVLGIAFVAAGTDSSTAYGSIFASGSTHGSGPNVGVYSTASGGSTNYALQIGAGDINTLAATNWLLLDNSATTLSWDAAGAANILLLSSADGEETVAAVAKATVTSALDAGTGDEYALDLAYTTNKATSGDDYGLRIRQTDTASPGTSYLLDLGVGANSQFYVTNTGIMTLYGSSWTDYMQWYGDTSDAFQKWSDGNLILMTDEATNSATAVEFKPKGSSEVSSLGLYDTDTRELWMHTAANRGYVDSGTGALGLQSNVVQDVNIWEDIGSGNPSVNVYGWNTVGSDLESTELTMDDTNDEFLIRAANSANHEGITIELDEASQLFRVRGSDGAVDFSSSDTALLAVNPATFNGTVDMEDHIAVGDGSSVSAIAGAIIDSDFTTASTGNQLQVTGVITVNGGTSDIAPVYIAPAVTLTSGAHGVVTSMSLVPPDISESGGTVTEACTLHVTGAPTEAPAGSNMALHIGAGMTRLGGTLDAESYSAFGNGSAVASNKTLIIDRDFSDTSDGEALSVVGSQIEVTAGTGDIHHTMMNPGSTTFNTAATAHNYATTLNILEPNIAVADGATVVHAATVRIVDAPTEGTTSNWSLWVDSGDVKFDGALTVDGLTTLGGGVAMGGDLDMAGNDIKNADDYYREDPASDTAPASQDFMAQNAYHLATVNTDGADTNIRAGIGIKKLGTITRAEAADNDIVRVTVNGSPTDITADTDFVCSAAASDAACACNFYDYVVANPITGLTPDRTDGSCSDEQVFFAVTENVALAVEVEIVDGGGGTPFAVAVEGLDGIIYFHNQYRNYAFTPGYMLAPDGGFTFSSSPATGVSWVSSSLQIAEDSGTVVTFLADGQTQYCNAAKTQCYTTEASAADTMKLWNGAGSGIGNLIVTGQANVERSLVIATDGYGVAYGAGTDGKILHNSDQTVDTLAVEPGTESNSVLMYQRGDNATDFLHPQQANPTWYTQSSDQTHIGEYAARRYNGTAAGAPVTDIAAHDMVYSGANAWAQAGVGVNRNGADVHVAAGIRTLALVCVDRTISDQDSITFTVNGVAQAALVESTDFNCDGEASEEVCCDNLGTAITTAAYGITPDCDTTAGTCYLTPDEDLISVDDIVITDFGGGAGFTLTEGTDGSVILSTGYAALTVGPATVTSANQLIVPDGAAASPGIRTTTEAHGLYRIDAANLGIAVAGVQRAILNNVGALTASSFYSTSLNLDAGGNFNFAGRTKCTSSADGIWECGINAGTQGVRFDAGTTDSRLILSDEGGGTIDVMAAGGFWTTGTFAGFDNTNLRLYTADANIFNNVTGGSLTVGSEDASTGVASGWVALKSGDQTNVGDYDSGDVTACRTGTTNTDGNTGNCIAQTGASGDGTGADAGDHIWNVNGANQRMKVDGSDGFLYVGSATQAARLDALTTDGVLDFHDEAGGALILGANTFQNSLIGATATFSSVNAAAAATGSVLSVSGNVTGVGDFVSGTYTAGSGDSSNTAGDSSNAMLKTGDAADDSGDVDVKMGVATAGTSGDFHVIGDGVNTYLTVNGETGDTTLASDLVVSGTGPHAFGSTVYDYSQYKFAGDFISGGADQHAEKMLLDGKLTGANGDTQLLTGFYAGANIQTQAAAEAITVASQFHLVEPNIAIGTATVTNAATLYIQSAPDEGTTRNAALFIEVGDVIMGDGMITNEPEAVQSLLAATTITSVNKYNPVVGNGGAVVITAAPTITAGSEGDEVCLIGTSDANTVEVQDETTIAGSLLELEGDVDMVLGLHDNICFVFYNSHWLETSRKDLDDD